MPGHPEAEYIGLGKRTQGTETSKYLQEKKSSRDSLSSGERTGKSLNRLFNHNRGCGADNNDSNRDS